MKNFILILIIGVSIPFVYLMGIQGLTFDEMLYKFGIKKEEEAGEE